jgi:hypothetical protein
MQPMYLVYSPPMMLPTQTLNPTASTARATAKAKRGLEDQVVMDDGEKGRVGVGSGLLERLHGEVWDADRWWWAGVGLTALGTVMYLMPTSL